MAASVSGPTGLRSTEPAAQPRDPAEQLADRFGRNLVLRRRQKGLSQDQLARVADLHRSALWLLESGQRLPRIDTVLKLAGALDEPPEHLFAGMRWHPGAAGSDSGTFHISSGREQARWRVPTSSGP